MTGLNARGCGRPGEEADSRWSSSSEDSKGASRSGLLQDGQSANAEKKWMKVESENIVEYSALLQQDKATQ